jgi:coatomer protein complex subunit alpha (xenin)
MFVKLEVETPRVKGLSFHPTRTWLLASFHSGEIVIYDYEQGVFFQRYNDHKGAVRSVHFHPSLPLFCSGSDDNSVRVFNYEKQRCLFAFHEHLDYVRSVQFHATQPFIVSASDDQTIRIFNWETRTPVSILSGHNHYVMSAFFHPSLPLILSASLDDTVRVWDVSALFNDRGSTAGIFSLTDAVLKFQQEEHVSGVNWACWHPSRPYALSCSDDQTVKIWKITDTDISVIATLRSHSSNVSCAIFHPILDVCISGSEDHTVRVWDSKRFVHLGKYRKADDRFWMVAAHPKWPIFAAGHDTGLTVFRLMRQRPTFDVTGPEIIYYRDCSIWRYNFETQTESSIGQTKPRCSGGRPSPLDPPPRKFQYSAAHKKLLVGHDEKVEVHSLGVGDMKVYEGSDPIWVSRSRFGWLSKGQMFASEVTGSSITPINIPPKSLRIFAGGAGCIFVSSTEQISLFDPTRQVVRAQRAIPSPRYAFLSGDRVAFLSSTSVTIAGLDLAQSVTFHDGARVKSGAWFEDFFVYSTKTQIKYLLPNGDSGIIRSIGERLYIAAVRERQVICLTSDAEVRRLDVDLTECRFKAALSAGRMDKVRSILRRAKLCSESIVDYLQRQGHPEVALLFVEDPAAKFRLALAAGDLQTAIDAAKALDDAAVWEALADEAMAHGLFKVAELALKRSGNQDRLALFYLLSGQIGQLSALKLDDGLSLQRAIWLNDRPAIVGLLRDAAPALAYVAAKSEEDQTLLDAFEVDDGVKSSVDESVSRATLRNKPQNGGPVDDWPLLNISTPTFEVPHDYEEVQAAADDAWAVNIDDEAVPAEAAEGWDISIDVDDIPLPAGGPVFIPPARGRAVTDNWAAGTRVPGELAAAGLFGQALDELQQQIALTNAAPLKEHFVAAWVTAHASVGRMVVPLSTGVGRRGLAPVVANVLERVDEGIKIGKGQTKANKLDDARAAFLGAMQLVPVVVCATIEENNRAKEAVRICRGYLAGILLELTRRANPDGGMPRQVELITYFTHCDIDADQLALILGLAMGLALKGGYFELARGFAERLRDIRPNDKAQQVIAITAGRVSTGQPIDYHPRNPFDVCMKSMKPIYQGSPKVVCPFCGACYKPEFRGVTCVVCELSKVGASAQGLTLVRPRRDAQ